MKFRTEIEIIPQKPISADERIVLIGSCFADNIGNKLRDHGFNVEHNPLGPLFNPVSTAMAIETAIGNKAISADDFIFRNGIWHALAWASRYQSDDRNALKEAVGRDFRILANAISEADTVFVTFGTAYVYYLKENGYAVGNCHKLPAAEFERRRISVDDIAKLWQPLVRQLKSDGKRVIFTVSPVRHVADGLHNNNISKATLLLAIDRLGAEYFPAYEIVCDDLRDYRFYAADLKHPSDTAIEYIFDKFSETYFTQQTKEISRRRHAEYLRAAHRPGNIKL